MIIQNNRTIFFFLCDELSVGFYVKLRLTYAEIFVERFRKAHFVSFPEKDREKNPKLKNTDCQIKNKKMIQGGTNRQNFE